MTLFTSDQSKLRQRISRVLGEESAQPIGAGNRWLSVVLILMAVATAWSMGQVTSGKPPQETANQEAADSTVDHTDEILRLAEKTRESYSAINTAHIRFQRSSNLQGFKPDINPQDCINLVLKLDLAKHPDRLKIFLDAFMKNPKKDGYYKLWYDYEMHAAKNKLRTSTERAPSKNGPDVHITNSTHSLLWDAVNFQLDIMPVNENRSHQYRLTDFVQPLPFDNAEKLEKSFRIRNHDWHYSLEHIEPTRSSEMQIDKTTGFTLRESHSNGGRKDYMYWLNWTQFPGEVDFPQVVANLNYTDGELTRCEFFRIESARFNIAIPESVFVMGAPAGANVFGDVKGNNHHHLESDVFDVMSVEQLTAATESVKMELTEEERRGIEAAKKLYTLADGQALKRLGPPFPLARKYVPQMLGGRVNRRPEQPSWILMQNGDKLTTVGLHTNGDFEFNAVLEKLFQLHSSAIEGDKDLLAMAIQGDFLFRKDSQPVDLLKALEEILKDEVQEDITVEFRDVDRPVYIATGDLKLNLRPKQTRIEMNAGPYDGKNGLIITSGDLDKFTSELSNYIDTEVVNQASPTAERLEWEERWYDAGMAANRPENGFDFQVPEVIRIVSEQTGLKFQKEMVKKKILFVERTKF